MRGLSRRSVLAGAPLLAGGVLLGGRADAATTVAPPGVVRPGDTRYDELVVGNNARWVARPDEVVLATQPAHVVDAVRNAVRTGRRVTVRSGGHCYEDFVYSKDTRVVIDLSTMDSVTFDADRQAFGIEPGATLWRVYETLFRRWGVTVPGGSCPTVGAGGHIAGGGYGELSRLFGLTVDHLYAVDVVVVDADGTVRLVTATREQDDPHRDLWWAHTGGGGGNFGVVTRYWMRSAGDPSTPLPKAPAEVLVSTSGLAWADLNADRFARLVRNVGRWHEVNSAPDSPAAALTAIVGLNHRSAGSIGILGHVPADRPGASELLRDFLTTAFDGVGTPTTDVRLLPWLHAVYLVGTNTPALNDPSLRADHKSAYFRRTPSEEQVAALYRNLTRDDFANPDAGAVLFSFGGRINAVAEDATAVAQRGSILKFLAQSFWQNPSDDAANIAWLRDLYGEMFAATGGVPIPNDLTDGCYVNYPDTDLSDPAWNHSDVPWSTLYYKGNYPRLSQVKTRWDPTKVFHHKQSVGS
ncbi:MAG TPA: FAD-binding protein [Pseudonocardiaceae bacterium]|nr:FAD-binding protein [Pseudonocardiaceae bacterium]